MPCLQADQKEKAAARDKLAFEESQKQLPIEIQNQRDQWWEVAQLPPKFIQKGFDDFDAKLQPQAHNAVRKYDGHSVILSSPGAYGVGKTHLVVALAAHLLDTSEAVILYSDGRFGYRHCPVWFCTETSLLARIRATYDHKANGETEEEVFTKIGRHQLLIIDDVGKVRPRDYSFLQGIYFRIIDERYVNEDQAVILTTNLDLTQLEEHIGGACADRLREMCGKGNIIKMVGKSYRK